jgi:hypothetical protein
LEKKKIEYSSSKKKRNRKHGKYGALVGLGVASILELLNFWGFKTTTLDERKQIFKTFLPRLRLKFIPTNLSRRKSLINV